MSATTPPDAAVDAAAVLYLNPELVAYGNVRTLSDVAAWLAANAAAPSPVPVATAIPATPAGFDPRVFLASQPDVSGLNETIRLAMLQLGISQAAVDRRGTFVATVMEEVTLGMSGTTGSATQVATLAGPEGTPFRFGATNVRPGDWVRLLRRGGARQGDAMHARVAAVPSGTELTFEAGTVSPATLVDSAAVYTLVGIRIWDAERQALVAYARMMQGLLQAVPTVPVAVPTAQEDIVPRQDFDLDMYHAVYPQTVGMGFPDAYLDYRTRWKRNNEYRIIKGRDIFNLSAPYTSNLLLGSGFLRVSDSNMVAGNGDNLLVRVQGQGLSNGLTAGGIVDLYVSGAALSNARGAVAALSNAASNAAASLSVRGALRVDDAGVVAMTGAVAVTASGDLVAGGDWSNLAVLGNVSGMPGSGPLSGAGEVRMGNGALVVSTASNSVRVSDRLGIGMECLGDEGMAPYATLSNGVALGQYPDPSSWWDVPSGSSNVGGTGGGSGTGDRTRLAVAGDIFATGTVVTLSDQRSKVNVRPIEGALERLSRLRGYTYEMAADSGFHPRRHTGLLAQEVALAMPEAVYFAPNGAMTASGLSAAAAEAGGPLTSIAYGNMVGLLVAAINELSAKVATLGGV